MKGLRDRMVKVLQGCMVEGLQGGMVKVLWWHEGMLACWKGGSLAGWLGGRCSGLHCGRFAGGLLQGVLGSMMKEWTLPLLSPTPCIAEWFAKTQNPWTILDPKLRILRLLQFKFQF